MIGRIDRTQQFWPVMIGLVTILTVIILTTERASSFRPWVVLVFLLLCPGMAFVRLLRLKDVLIEAGLAIALSLAIDAIITTSMLYLGIWSAFNAMFLLMGITIVGVLLKGKVNRQDEEQFHMNFNIAPQQSKNGAKMVKK